jgi:hypothetical protein
LVALCRRVGSDGATNIFNQIHPWFLSDPKRKSLQKKAYRILSELYKRRDDPQLSQFFEYIQPTVGDILSLEVKQVSEPAWAARLAVFRFVSFGRFEGLIYIVLDFAFFGQLGTL